VSYRYLERPFIAFGERRARFVREAAPAGVGE
jgi:hypothetical protein